MKLNEKIKNSDDILEESIATSMGIHRYLRTLDLKNIDAEYRRNFTTFYKVRLDKKYLKQIYDFFEEMTKEAKKGKTINFEDVFNKFHEITKKNLISYTSKFMHTLYPESYAIWDSKVCSLLDIDDGEENAIKKYEAFNAEIHDFAKSESGQKLIKKFNLIFPKYQDITSIKKIDFALWGLGKSPNKSKYLFKKCLFQNVIGGKY